MLTARTSEDDRVRGLEGGRGRLRAQAVQPARGGGAGAGAAAAGRRTRRRAPRSRPGAHRRSGGRHLAARGSGGAATAVALTPTEFRLLETLARSPGAHVHARGTGGARVRPRLRRPRPDGRFAHHQPAAQTRCRARAGGTSRRCTASATGWWASMISSLQTPDPRPGRMSSRSGCHWPSARCGGGGGRSPSQSPGRPARSSSGSRTSSAGCSRRARGTGPRARGQISMAAAARRRPARRGQPPDADAGAADRGRRHGHAAGVGRHAGRTIRHG